MCMTACRPIRKGHLDAVGCFSRVWSPLEADQTAESIPQFSYK